MGQLIVVLAIGLAAGLLSGFFGIGGGVLIVPALVLLLGMPQHSAVGTSLGALLPPVGLLGAWEYYRAGDLNFVYAALLALGLASGAYVGAEYALQISEATLRRAFAAFLILIAVRLLVR